jgi:hypothetical protein
MQRNIRRRRRNKAHRLTGEAMRRRLPTAITSPWSRGLRRSMGALLRWRVPAFCAALSSGGSHPLRQRG